MYGGATPSRLLLLLFLEAALLRPPAALALGNIGCLFSSDLCAEEFEWCFDDYAFGRCLPLYGHVSEEFLHRRELGPVELQILEAQMSRLFEAGFRWSHAYTQCVMQASLRTLQLGEELDEDADPDECVPLADLALQVTPRQNEGKTDGAIDAKDVAFVRFVPSAKNPHPDFADELYFPPLEQRSASNDVEAFAYEKKSEKPEPFHFSRHLGLQVGNDNSNPSVMDVEQEEQLLAASQPAYTEGGLVYLPQGEENKRKSSLDAKASRLSAILAQYGDLDWGFKRRERLDVKKPGPPFHTNSYAYDTTNEIPSNDKEEEKMQSDQPSSKKLQLTREVMEKHVSADTNEIPQSKTRRRPPPPPQPPLPPPGEDDLSHLDLVDPSYAFVGFKNRVSSWKQGADVVNAIADLLHLDRSDLSNVRVDVNEVTFKVEEPNEQGLNASEVARRVDSLKQQLKDLIGVEVSSSGIGDKNKLPNVTGLGAGAETERQILILGLLVSGVLFAGAVAAGVLVLLGRHAKTRAKLQQLNNPDQASKDYQDLCRARMATKSEKGEICGSHRVVSLTKEGDGNNSPNSNRSSTSSWSEEPALTNMDISTGHMVLSYMEDHLHNKGRLDQEWAALCAYEAEPNETTVATKQENKARNRYENALPYDHARVVLNELANANGSDYINASSITDHDPRNPAYIATQGPLETTVADFWQMVWEQGSVVMVMLTRLNENGAVMCHRYWPEEGSGLYHIYEVHLVSEHVWCDDYLVRSFYLKNVKTGETRTVTQFHFLSWPEGAVPHSIKALLEFRRKVNKSYRGRSCPIVVHCSDGAGRTGTYCLLDMVLNRMSKGAKEIDIAATLEHIRDQRCGMVRSKAQFELVLMAVAEEVHAILKALPQ
ncbi:receptor-type tyrosine-protein phosphatase-like N isoform X2 [Neocloeon triangulifer]|uniref:receptor-type tyrosine-protein phosphatase-like N isoform X2 n=1 Tax=Neocloeon triangulifer TaxID=2078957 RepID=UPI00286EEEE1|nr:receptor-type tyrosine-protein phosphatase-like N isoform X2 [Neocloeon triangulifer]